MYNLKILRKEYSYTQDKLAKILGVSRSTISMWETNECQPDNDMLIKIASTFNVSIDYLLGNRSIKKTPSTKIKGVKIPVLGEVAAGVPIEAVEDILDYEEISETMASHGEYFGLRIKGASMEPRMHQGDVVIVRQQSDVDNGCVAVILVNGDSATVKKVKKDQNGIMLIPFNQSFEPMFYSNEEIESLPVSILGKVVELRAKF